MSVQDVSSSLTCGYCLTDLDDGEVTKCEACGTSYHRDCWVEYGGCTVFGCRAWTQRQMISAAAPFAPAAFAPAPAPAPQAAPPPAAPPQDPFRPVGPPITTGPMPAFAPQTPPGQAPAALTPSGLPPAGWHPDPRRRHEYRYWNGRSWTALVSNAGVPSTDPHGIRPTPLPAPYGDGRAPAEWYTDPTQRHQYRYWAGRAWTERVADNGVVSTDPATMEPS